MKKTIRDIGSTKVHLWQFLDWMEVAKTAMIIRERHNKGVYGGLRCTSILGKEVDFYGSSSLGEAINFFIRGWPEGRELLRKHEPHKMALELFRKKKELYIEYGKTGDEVNVGRLLDGEPDHMMAIYENETDNLGLVPVIGINIAHLSNVEISQIQIRGIAIMTIFSVLDMLGVPFEIRLVASSEFIATSSHVSEIHIPISRSMSLDTLFFMTVSVSMFRRIIFAAKETEEKTLRERMGVYDDGGYGRSCTPLCIGDVDYLFDTITRSPYSFESVSEIPIIVRDVLEKLGITI